MSSQSLMAILSSAFVGGMTLVSGAADLYWQKDNSQRWAWNGDNAFWKVGNVGGDVSWNSQGEPKTACFTAATQLAIAGPIPTSVVVDSEGKVLIYHNNNMSWGNAFNGLTSLVKKGSGDFEISDSGNFAGGGITTRSDMVWDLQEGGFLLNISSSPVDNRDPKAFLGGSTMRIAAGARFDAKVKSGVGLADGLRPSVELNGGSLNLYGQYGKNYVNELAYNGGSVSLVMQSWDSSTWGNGDLTIMGKLTVTGAVARTLSVSVDSKLATHGVCLNPGPVDQTEICVEDVTGDVADDLTVSASGAAYSTTNGFVKTGAGTARLANRWNKFTGLVKIDEGTLILDGGAQGQAPEVSVAAGAFLGGTGTVQAVTLAAGSGLAVAVGQAEPLKVTSAVALPANGVVSVIGAGEPPERMKQPVILCENGLAGDISGWTILWNGQPTDRLVLQVKENVVRVKGLHDPGMMLIFR